MGRLRSASRVAPSRSQNVAADRSIVKGRSRAFAAARKVAVHQHAGAFRVEAAGDRDRRAGLPGDRQAGVTGLHQGRRSIGFRLVTARTGGGCRAAPVRPRGDGCTCASAVRVAGSWTRRGPSARWFNRPARDREQRRVRRRTSSGAALPLLHPQNTGADPFTSPVRFDRQAACGRYCPSGITRHRV